jgi:hypothetical protein
MIAYSCESTDLPLWTKPRGSRWIANNWLRIAGIMLSKHNILFNKYCINIK